MFCVWQVCFPVMMIKFIHVDCLTAETGGESKLVGTDVPWCLGLIGSQGSKIKFIGWWN